MSKSDRRLTPARADLAAERLRGLVDASHYSAGEKRRVAMGVCPVRREPRGDAPLESEAVLGEIVTVYEEIEGWAWGQLERDQYVGYLPSASLASATASPTHRIGALRSFCFPGPDIKLPPSDALPFLAEVAVQSISGPLAELQGGGFVPACHLSPLGQSARDYVDVALRFVGTPYLWGGKTAFGTDCSGLVQTALFAAGIAAPRDSDLQEAALGRAVEDVGRNGEGLQRGDLLFWKGHVAIACGRNNILHANAHHMAVTVEPARDAIHRIAATGNPLRTVKRL